MSFGLGLESRSPYPKWMIDTGLAQLGTQSKDRLSATQQEDAHDFLRQWLDNVHDLHEEQLKKLFPESKVCNTVIDHVFGGVLVSRVECQHCGQVSNTYDSMNDLSIEVDNGQYGVLDSIYQALASFVEPEVMSGDNAYYCEWCKRKMTAHKSLHIHTSPNTLTLHLKRFRPDFIKLTGQIAFKPFLNLAPFLSPDSPDLPPAPTFPNGGRSIQYKLTGVLVHQGTWSSAGHYYAYVIDADGQWWLMNDDNRRRVYLNEVLRCDAYMLFYVRSHPRQDPPIVPQSHVTPPSTRKRCAPLSPLEEGEVDDGEIGPDLDSVPLCKRAKYQAQQNGGLVRVTAPHGQQPSHAAAAGSQANAGMLTQPNGLYADGHSNGCQGMSNGSCASHLRPQAAEGMDEGRGGPQNAVSGASFIGPLNQSPPDAVSTRQTAPNGDASTHQHRHNTGQPGSSSNGSANGFGWRTADVNPGQAAANSPGLAAASSPSAATNGSPQRFGFLGFALPTALNKGRPPSRLGLVAASDSQAACVTPPSQKFSSASARPGSHGLPPLHGRQSPHALPMDPLFCEEKPLGRCGHKRSRIESECDVELVLEDETHSAQDCKAPSQASQNPPAPPSHPAASKQSTSQSSSQGLPAGHRNHGQTDDKGSAKVLPTTSAAASLDAGSRTLPQAPCQPPLCPPSFTSNTHPNQLPSMHQRTPAPSFIKRRLPALNSALLSSDAPPHLKYAPPQARSQLPSGSFLQNTEAPQQAAQSGSHTPALLSNGVKAEGSSNVHDHSHRALSRSQEPAVQMPREAFPQSFGSSSSSRQNLSHWQTRVDGFKSHTAQPDSQPSQEQSRTPPPTLAQTDSGNKQLPGRPTSAQPSESRVQHAGKLIAAGDSKQSAAGKSVRKQGVLGRMKNTVTGWLQPKSTEQNGGSQELQNLAALYPSDDCSDGP